MRIQLSEDPYLRLERDRAWNEHGIWPCFWISCPDVGRAPFVTAFRRHFTLPGSAKIRVHVSADERYELFLDGRRVGRGSERGDVSHWFFETYDLVIEAGEHVLVARTWSLGDLAPYAQMSLHPGLILSPQEEQFAALLGTGTSPWEAKELRGFEFTNPMTAWGTGANLVITGSAFDWGYERGEGTGWEPAIIGHAGSTSSRNDCPPCHLLTPAILPAMMEQDWCGSKVCLVAEAGLGETHSVPVCATDNIPDEAAAWQNLIQGKSSLILPPRVRRRILLDLEDYACAYPEVRTSGGAGSSIRIHWQESLFCEPDAQTKGNRNEVEGKYFINIWWLNDGIGDTFWPDGGNGRRFETLWWQCGRYVEILVQTAGEPLTIESWKLRETRYPLENEGSFECSDQRLLSVIPLAVRVVQMCSHETYMDCPYFEQLMYIGDTRLQMLTTYVMAQDDRLPRKALQLFDWSRENSGVTQSRYPTRVRQITPPFSLWWVAAIHDYILWRGDPGFVASLMPGARTVLDAFCRWTNPAGLVEAPQGWNFVDWVPEWADGIPPGGHTSSTSAINWSMILALRQAAEVEEWLGESEMAARWRRVARKMEAALTSAFWVEERGLFADDLEREHFSEHAQCLAILGGGLADARRVRVASALLNDPGLARTTIYFTHYLFEAYRSIGRMDRFFDRMDLWFNLERQGFKTTVEMPEPSRSDCHAWGAHPLYHYFASLLGIRPAAPGFSQVEIAPQPGPLTHLSGRLPHPQGEISAILQRSGRQLRADITLPEGISGTFRYGGQSILLHPGQQEISCDENLDDEA